MAQWLSSLIMFIGRILIGAIFVWSSFDKAVNFGMYEGLLHVNGITPPFWFLIGAMALEFFAGLALMLGLFARFSALLLLIYMVPATFVFHDFWLVGPSAEKHFRRFFS
jgi:putative oxidoreductase